MSEEWDKAERRARYQAKHMGQIGNQLFAPVAQFGPNTYVRMVGCMVTIYDPATKTLSETMHVGPTDTIEILHHKFQIPLRHTLVTNDAKQMRLDSIHQTLLEMGISDNQYLSLTVETLPQSRTPSLP